MLFAIEICHLAPFPATTRQEKLPHGRDKSRHEWTARRDKDHMDPRQLRAK